MKVLVITGSPHKKGTSALLVSEFIRGAEEAGHEVSRFDAAFKAVHPCIACEQCHTAAEKGCVFKDDMNELLPLLANAEAVVFASPVYYFTISAQLKAAVDRFYAIDEVLHEEKKAMLMVTMSDSTVSTADGALAFFRGTTGYLGWKDVGTLVAAGCTTRADIENTDYPQQAYEMGKNLQ